MAMLFDTTDTAGDHTGQALYYDPANAKRMRSLVIQDEGLHYYTRTPGFSWD